MFHLSEQGECWYCRRRFEVRWPGQRFCRAHCRRMGKAIEGRASRKAWIDQGRPIQAEIREAFDRDHRAIAVAAIRRR